MNKKFLLVSQVFYPDEVSTAGLFTDLCEKIIQKNIRVTVLCAQPSYNTLIRQPARVNHQGIDIQYLFSTNFNKNNPLGRILNYITFSCSLAFKLLLSRDKSEVFVSTNPPYLGILVAFLCKLRKRKFIYIIQDVFPEGLCRLGIMSRRNPFVRVWNSLNRLVVKNSLKVIVLGRDMKKWLGDFYPAALPKTTVIPIWQNEDLIFPVMFIKNPLVIREGLREKFVVQYSGNMGLWNDMKIFAQAALNINDPEVIFTFIGDGIRKRELLKEWNNKIPDNVRMYSFQPRKDLNNLLSSCHIALISLREGMEGMAVPSKIMGILASAKPVIAAVPESSEISYILQEENCGIRINPDDVQGVINAVLFLKENDRARSDMGANARKAFEKKYTSVKAAASYISILEKD